MEASQQAIQPETAWGTLASYHGETVTIVALTAAGIEAAAESMEYLSELTAVSGREVATADAPDYVRPTVEAAWTLSGPVGERKGTLGYAEGEDPRADLTGAPSVAGWAFVSAGGSDSSRKIISVNRFPETGGGPDFAASAPNGFATAERESPTIGAQVEALEARTVAGVAFVDGDVPPADLAEALGIGGGTGTETSVVDGVIAADAVDGTGVQFTALVLDHGATAAGIVPAGWAGVPGLTDLDATELAALLAMGWPSGATFIVFSDGAWSVRSVTDATVDEPWTAVTAVDVTGGVLGSLIDDGFFATDAWRVLYSGTGLFAGQTNVGGAMHQFEGALDRWFFASAVGTTDKDLADLGAETWEYGDLKFTDGNSDPVDFCHVWLFGQTDPAENGAYTVNDDFTYAKIPHPDVFDPPGQGYRVTVVAPGDPASGTTWVWLVDKPDTHFRANGSTDPDEAGEWVLWIDTAGGGSLDADLTAIAGLTPSNDDILQRKAGAWVNRTPAQLKADLPGWQTISRNTLVSTSSSESFTITGYRMVRITFAGRGTRSATADSVRMRFNSDTGSNYSDNTGAYATYANPANISGSLTNTNRSGFGVIQWCYVPSHYLAGTCTWTAPSSTASTGYIPETKGFQWIGAASAAPTTVELYCGNGDFAAGTEFLVEGYV